MPHSVVLDALRYSIREREIIAPLTLTLSEPRIGIIGRNGSGKSTLMRLIAGLIAPDEGQVSVCGVDVYKDRKSAPSLIGVLFQNPDHQIIFPTVVEELGFGLRQLGRTKTEAETGALDMLARFGRADWATRPVHGLSQGQRHLVCLMSVLAMAPNILLLDEPYAGLDLPTRLQLGRLLDGVNQNILHITHQTEALQGYDRVLWLEAGRILADGRPDEVIPAFQTRMREAEGQDAFADL